MKNVILLLSMLIIVSSCATNSTGVNTQKTQKQIDKEVKQEQKIKEDIVSDIPDWFINQPADSKDIFYFTGQGESKLLQMALDIATLQAQSQLANAIESYLSQQTKLFETQSGTGDDIAVTQDLESATKVIVKEAQTGGFRIAKKDIQAKGNNYVAYVLLEYIAGHANKLLYQQIKKNAETEAKLRQSEAFKELEESIAGN